MRTRPRQHKRRLKTGKKVLVNKGVRKTVRISNKTRKVFDQLGDPKSHSGEFGGNFDFNKQGVIEQIRMVPGHGSTVMLDPDYEAQWHTHPYKYPAVPSDDDIIALLNNPYQKSEIIFNDGHIFVITKTQKTEALSRLPATKQQERLDKAFDFPMWPTTVVEEKKFFKELRKLGFKVQKFKPGSGAAVINIKPEEP